MVLKILNSAFLSIFLKYFIPIFTQNSSLNMKKSASLFICLIVSLSSFSQQITIGDNKGAVTFEEYDPKSTLVVDKNPKVRSKFPFIDVHNHQYAMGESKDNVDRLIPEMDKLNMQILVNLSGRGWTKDQDKATKTLTANVSNSNLYPGRFAVFTNVDFDSINETGWSEKAAKMLEADVKLRGAVGLKIYKNLGFSVKNADGSLVRVDDPRIDAVWAKAGELGIPVIIHSADPASFWEPLNQFNERWLELKTHPGRKKDVTKGDFGFEEIIAQQHNVFRKHKGTKFISAHMGWYPNNLGKLDSLLTALPNMYVEIGAVIAEIGRQPRTSNKFFTKWQDRILFGKDSWVPSEYATYFRVLETEDEYFQYHKKYHAFWPMYGIGLSDDVLKKVYYKNALKIIPRLDKSGFPE
jgi:predicted TIM-barrel fold metal-dependent hydrolase